jgi:uncharacterized protein YaiI (UPF0178 family)
MKILVDADSCPVKDIIVKVAKTKSTPVVMVSDYAHEIRSSYATVIRVDKGRDSADLALINNTSTDDVVVTQDYGVATLALSKNAKAIGNSGLIYTNDNIESLLMQRHMCAKERKKNKRFSKIPKRTKEDDAKFEKNLKILLHI